MVRQNLLAAAHALGLTLDFRPVRDPARLFRIITPGARAARPKHGSRPRSQEPAAAEQPAVETPSGSTADEGYGAPKRRRRQRRTAAAGRRAGRRCGGKVS
ncbi:MAG: hypothetical protein M3R24_31325 [Chloroflexota bacterium]|nr:hypothetical protein [Chloroflexota bacterium]